ncbi:MAG: hypothetical protein WC565_10515 [Parcubacteria group bacterium]
MTIMWIPIIGVAAALGLWYLVSRDEEKPPVKPPEGRPPSPVASDVRMRANGPSLDPDKADEAYSFAVSRLNDEGAQAISWIIIYDKSRLQAGMATPVLALPQEKNTALAQGKILVASMRAYGYKGYRVEVSDCVFRPADFIRFAMGDLSVVYENTCYPMWQDEF